MPDRLKMVAFEISNRCVYSHLHDRCPVDPKSDPVFLEMEIILHVLKYLGSLDYEGRLYFNIYNEPLCDPRLFTMLGMAEDLVPKAYVDIYTNGWNLNQYMLEELLKHGVKEINVSTYDYNEYDRLSVLKCPETYDGHKVVYNVNRTCLDDRMGVYFNPEVHSGKCLGPFVYLFINHKGEVSLCCFDYRYTCTFGNLHESSIVEILNSEKRRWVCQNLECGIRIVPVCRKCDSQSFFEGAGR